MSPAHQRAGSPNFSACSAVLLCLLALAASNPPMRAAERHALILAPHGMPVHLEAATFFDDGRLFSAVWRNSTREMLYPRLRVFVFDPRGELTGSVWRCSAEPLQPGTRAQVRVDVEVAAATSRHRFVALVEEVRSSTAIWRVQERGDIMADVARRLVTADRADVTVIAEQNPNGDLACACECGAAEALGREGCGGQVLAAFTCTPVFFPAGCTQSYTCR